MTLQARRFGFEDIVVYLCRWMLGKSKTRDVMTVRSLCDVMKYEEKFLNLKRFLKRFNQDGGADRVNLAIFENVWLTRLLELIVMMISMFSFCSWIRRRAPLPCWLRRAAKSAPIFQASRAAARAVTNRRRPRSQMVARTARKPRRPPPLAAIPT